MLHNIWYKLDHKKTPLKYILEILILQKFDFIYEQVFCENNIDPSTNEYKIKNLFQIIYYCLMILNNHSLKDFNSLSWSTMVTYGILFNFQNHLDSWQKPTVHEHFFDIEISYNNNHYVPLINLNTCNIFYRTNGFYKNKWGCLFL